MVDVCDEWVTPTLVSIDLGTIVISGDLTNLFSPVNI